MLQAFNQNHQQLHHHHRHPTTKVKIPNFAQNNFWFFYLIFTTICFPTLSKKFFWKKWKMLMLQAIIERSSNNHPAIIKLQNLIPELCSKQLVVFLFDIQKNMFPHIHHHHHHHSCTVSLFFTEIIIIIKTVAVCTVQCRFGGKNDPFGETAITFKRKIPR